EKPDAAKAELDYCLQRLVRGLASSRKFARVGYAVALTKEVGSKLRDVFLPMEHWCSQSKRLSCTQCLLDIVNQASPEVFTAVVWPQLESSGRQDLLKGHWGAARRSVEMPQLLPLLLETIVTEVMSKTVILCSSGPKLEVNPLLTSTLPRKQTAMSLFNLLFKHASDPEEVCGILFPAVASLLCRTAEHKESQLLDVCSKAESLLTDWCKAQGEEGGVVDTVKGFLQTSHRHGLTAFLHSATFSSIISSLRGQDIQTFAQFCMDAVLGRNTFSAGEDGQATKSDLDEKVGRRLVFLLRIAILNPTVLRGELPSSVLKFLFLHTFFRVTTATKDIPHCQEVSPELSPSMRNTCQTTFYRILKQLLSSRPERMTHQEQVLNYIRVLTDLAHYAQHLLSSPKHVQPVKEIGDEVQAEWQSVMNIISVKQGQKRKSVSTSLGEAEMFKLLILHLAFDLFLEPGPTSELLQDVYVCRDKAVKKTKSKPGADGASKLARETTVAVFRSLCPHLTPSAVSLITQVLKSDKSKKGPDEDLFEFEDMKAVLGPAAADSDNDEEEEDLTDSEMLKFDEQLAAAFRSMKRPSKKDKEQKQREISSFRLRALDLLEVIAKSDRYGDLGLELLEPLLRLVLRKTSDKHDKEQQLCRRATEIFHILCKQRHMADSIHSLEEMLNKLQSLLQLAQAVTKPQLAAEVANGCLFIMRLMTHQPDAAVSPVKTRAMRETADDQKSQQTSHDAQHSFVQAVQSVLEKDLVVRRNSKCSMVFFSSMIQKYPTVFWPLLSTLVKSLQSSDTKVHTKTQACTLLALLLRLNKRASLSDEQWNSFLQTAPPVLNQLVLQQQKDSVKSGLMLELLTVLFQAVHSATKEEQK
ncbi:hypothetical protein BaRGS_00037971, partial [Batillaria attramentaria]